jgi:hypothetical protein
MKNISARFAMLSAVCAALLLAACGPSHEIRDEALTKDPRFGFERLRGKGFLVAGVSAQTETLTAEERATTSGTVSNMLIEYLGGAPDIRIVPSGKLVSTLGLYEYHMLMMDADAEGVLLPETMARITKAEPDVEFILLAHIVNENIVDYQQEHVVPGESGDTRETDYEKQYFLTIDFQIYDARLGKMLLNNTIYNRLTRKETRTTRTGCMEMCFDTFVDMLFFGEPAEIGRLEVLEGIVERFAVNLQRVHARE